MMVEHNQSKYYKVPYPTTNTGSYDNKWKFNGKELDDATGMYYYGARYYDPRISVFVSVDQMVESTMTPYQYVHNNPINLIDPTGMSANPVFDEKGNYLGNTKEGFKGDILIYRGLEDSSFFENMTANEFLTIEKDDAYKLDDLKGAGIISNGAYENIWNHTASQLEGKEYFGKTFKMKNVGGIKYKKGDFNWLSRYSSGDTGEIFGSGKYDYESTVENIQSSIVIHEYISHIQHKFGDDTNNHRMSYALTMSTGALWNSTTAKYKEFVWKNYNIYKNIELHNKSINPNKIPKYSSLIFKTFF